MKSRTTTATYSGMPTINLLAGILALTIVTAGCTGTQNAQEQEPVDTNIPVQPESRPRANILADTDWKAVSILGKPAGSADSTLGFSKDGQVAGNGGCNGYQGGVTLDGDTIEFGALASTRMMCAPPVSGQEIVFLEALSLARTWKRSGSTLELIDDSNEVVLQLSQQ